MPIQHELWGGETIVRAKEDSKSLSERFVIPPFSVFDTRQGYWQQRKKVWISKGILGELGRDGSAYNTQQWVREKDIKGNARFLTGTSIFDPVLCEVLYKWFCPKGGHIINPMAGESVYGVVAGCLGYSYEGVELRSEQIESNREQWSSIKEKEQSIVPTMKISAAWASKQLNCTKQGIENCKGVCCSGPKFWPPSSGTDGCPHLGTYGCLLVPGDKPVMCHLFPMRLTDKGMLVLWGKASVSTSYCGSNYGHGPMIVEALYDNLAHLFGTSVADYIVKEVKAGRDPVIEVPPQVSAALQWEEQWAEENIAPKPRSVQWRGHQQTIVDPVWILGDGRDVVSLTSKPADFIICCPPYFDLEVYSDDPRDLSTYPTYDKFLDDYYYIIEQTLHTLQDDRFIAFVVSDIRDKDGYYRSFVGDTIAIFGDLGARLYNEAILLGQYGSLPIRVAKQFVASRKLGRTHQNVLIFVKGDWKKALERINIDEFS